MSLTDEIDCADLRAALPSVRSGISQPKGRSTLGFLRFCVDLMEKSGGLQNQRSLIGGAIETGREQTAPVLPLFLVYVRAMLRSFVSGMGFREPFVFKASGALVLVSAMVVLGLNMGGLLIDFPDCSIFCP